MASLGRAAVHICNGASAPLVMVSTLFIPAAVGGVAVKLPGADSADPKEPPTTWTSVCTSDAVGCAPDLAAAVLKMSPGESLSAAANACASAVARLTCTCDRGPSGAWIAAQTDPVAQVHGDMHLIKQVHRLLCAALLAASNSQCCTRA